MDPTSTDSTTPTLGEPAATTDTGPSLDQMIAEAEAANPGAPAEQPTTETPPAGDEPKAEPEAETKPPAEEPKVEEKAEVKDDGISEKRARQILDAASRKHQAAEKHTQTFVENVRRELETDPDAALRKYFGTTVDRLIDLSTGIATPAERPDAKPETSARETELDRRIARIEERERMAEVHAKVAEIKGAVAADAKTFPTINAKGKHDVVIDFMTEYYNTHGSPIAWKEAAKLVEAELRELTGGEAPAPAAARPASTPVTPPKPTTALTNGDVRTTAPVDEEPTDPDELIKWLTNKEEARLSRRAS